MKTKITLPKSQKFVPPARPSKRPAEAKTNVSGTSDKLLNKLRDAYRQAHRGDCTQAFNTLLDVAFIAGQHRKQVNSKVFEALKLMRTAFPEHCSKRR